MLGLKYESLTFSMTRTGVGSAVQLSTYDGTKNYLLKSGYFHLGSQGHGYVLSLIPSRIELHFCASLLTSFFVCIAMNPFDVASVRMYNQQPTVDGRKGSLYKNGLDCIGKTVRAEGVFALYKGLGAHYLRIGPHTILTFVILEQLKKVMQF